jgi:hypothetical protein
MPEGMYVFLRENLVLLTASSLIFFFGFLNANRSRNFGRAKSWRGSPGYLITSPAKANWN